MRMLIYGLLAVGIFSTSDVQAQTQAGATVGGALQTLEFEVVKPKGNNVGGPQKFEVTAKTIQSLRRDRFWVKSDGTITHQKPAAVGAGAQATQEQSWVTGALESLKFHYVKPGGKIVGGDQEFEVRRDTSQFLKGKTFWVTGEGTISFTEPKD